MSYSGDSAEDAEDAFGAGGDYFDDDFDSGGSGGSAGSGDSAEDAQDAAASGGSATDDATPDPGGDDDEDRRRRDRDRGRSRDGREPGREDTRSQTETPGVDGRKTRLSGSDAPGNETGGVKRETLDEAGDDGERVFDEGDDPLVPDDGRGLEDRAIGATGPSQANEDRLDERVERLQGRLDRADNGLLAVETDEYNITRRGDELVVTRTDEGTLEATEDAIRDAGRDPGLFDIRQRAGGVDVEFDQEEASRRREAARRRAQRSDDGGVDGRGSIILGEAASRNPTDDPLAVIRDAAGDEGERVFDENDDPLLPDTPEDATEIGADLSDERVNELGASDTVGGFTTVAGTERDPEVRVGFRATGDPVGSFTGATTDEVERVDGRRTLLEGIAASSNPTDDVQVTVLDEAGDEGLPVFQGSASPLTPAPGEGAGVATDAEAPLADDQAELAEDAVGDAPTARSLPPSVTNLLRAEQPTSPTASAATRAPVDGAAERAQDALAAGELTVTDAGAVDGGSGERGADKVAASGRVVPPQSAFIDADAVWDPTLRRAEAEARRQERLEELGLGEEEQFGDIDYSGGLGGEEDEVEQFVDDTIGGFQPELGIAPDERPGGDERAVSGPAAASPTAQLAVDPEFLERDSAFAQGTSDAIAGLSELPGQALEGVETAAYLTDATPAAGGSEELYDERFEQVEQAAVGRGELAADFASQNPGRFATSVAVGSLAEIGVASSVARAAGAGAGAGRISAASSSVARYTPDLPARSGRSFLSDTRGQAGLSGLSRADGDERVEVADDEALAVPDDASQQRAAQAGFRGSRRAQERIDDPDSELNNPADATPLEDAADRGVSPSREAEVVDTRPGGDFVASAEVDMTPRAGAADVSRFAASRADETGQGLTPRQQQLAQQLDPQLSDLRDVVDLETRLRQDSRASVRAPEVGPAVGGLIGGSAAVAGPDEVGLLETDPTEAESAVTGQPVESLTDDVVGSGIAEDLGAGFDARTGLGGESDIASQIDETIDERLGQGLDQRLGTRVDERQRAATEVDTELDVRSETRFEQRAESRAEARAETRFETRLDVGGDLFEPQSSDDDRRRQPQGQTQQAFNPIATPTQALFGTRSGGQSSVDDAFEDGIAALGGAGGDIFDGENGENGGGLL